MNIKKIESATNIFLELRRYKEKMRIIECALEDLEECHVHLSVSNCPGNNSTLFASDIKSELLTILVKEKEFLDQKIADCYQKIEEL